MKKNKPTVSEPNLSAVFLLNSACCCCIEVSKLSGGGRKREEKRVGSVEQMKFSGVLLRKSCFLVICPEKIVVVCTECKLLAGCSILSAKRKLCHEK